MSQQKGRGQSKRLPQGGEDAQERLVSVKTIKATSGQRSRQKTGGRGDGAMQWEGSRRGGYSQVSMSAEASFPVAPKWILMNFPCG